MITIIFSVIRSFVPARLLVSTHFFRLAVRYSFATLYRRPLCRNVFGYCLVLIFFAVRGAVEMSNQQIPL